MPEKHHFSQLKHAPKESPIGERAAFEYSD